MSENSAIQWTDHTWNPWHGCIKVSPGCKFCYMYRDKERYGQDPTTVLRSKTKFREPLAWKDSARVFTCSWSDFFIEQADEWRSDAWGIIKDTPHLTYQILTKRPENIIDRLPDDWGDGYPNVWLGVSVEDIAAEHRLYTLQEDVPAKVKFASFEPLLSYMFHVTMTDLDWAIIGGESGNTHGKYRYRPCEISWIEKLIDEAREQDAAIFVKQLGTHLAKELKLRDSHGGDINEWPESIRIREFPTIP
jgi:protein gp37